MEPTQSPDNDGSDPDATVFWSNPDIPRADRVIDGSAADADGAVTFDCPYDGDDTPFGNAACQNDLRIDLADDPDTARSELVNVLQDDGGTLRCAECNEPLYGFRGNGDHE